MNFTGKILKGTTVIIAALSLALSSASCSSQKEIVYFQDITSDSIATSVSPKQLVIRPNDKISIFVNSRDPQLVDIFNLPLVSRQLGRSSLPSSRVNSSINNQYHGLV